MDPPPPELAGAGPGLLRHQLILFAACLAVSALLALALRRQRAGNWRLRAALRRLAARAAEAAARRGGRGAAAAVRKPEHRQQPRSCLLMTCWIGKCRLLSKGLFPLSVDRAL